MVVTCCQLLALFLTSPQATQVTDVTASHTTWVEALRAKAREAIVQEQRLYSVSELQDIEARYRAAHRDDFPMFLRPDAAPILLELIARYPKSNRSGCAVLDLARLVADKRREHYLRQAITDHGDAWCASGVQVGALARARLAVYYAGRGRFDEAERLAEELVRLFPGAIDESGASLGDVLNAVRLLREPSESSDL